MSAAIRKAGRITGHKLVFRNVKASDAAFILSLRLDEVKSRYLSKVQPDLEAQQAWLMAYAERRDEAYFIIETLEGRALGTVRLYDAKGDSFCWGSWLLSAEAPGSAAIESALIVYSYACDRLEFTRSHFSVHKANASVCRFHERFGARRVSESQLEYDYVISAESIAASRQRYARYLPDPITVLPI